MRRLEPRLPWPQTSLNSTTLFSQWHLSRQNALEDWRAPTRGHSERLSGELVWYSVWMYWRCANPPNNLTWKLLSLSNTCINLWASRRKFRNKSDNMLSHLTTSNSPVGARWWASTVELLMRLHPQRRKHSHARLNKTEKPWKTLFNWNPPRSNPVLRLIDQKAHRETGNSYPGNIPILTFIIQ